jgi:DNA-binding XRE family transcriptional regulator
MTAEMTLHSIGSDMAIINVQLPAKDAGRAAEAIKHLLAFGGQDVLWINDDGERLLSVEEVFPDMTPAKVLRGLRGKEELTQAEFAERIGISQHHISEMETGKRSITADMAKRIGKIFDVSYKVFL